ncbi:hypothetical protein [Lacticaseibacillus hulanensis]|uniref:ATP-binding protein n=1 Tax=Lacticaseibacillus hulanensis TaxID=2493111 RepID=UPI0013E30E70|nr:hypothetical protein [Lacticaseibacillus hulanensis]
MTNFKSVLVIGSGPVSSAQPATSAADTDLSCRALVAAGKTVILVTSDPNVFRDQRMATHFYVSPLTADFVSQVIRRENPDAIIATAGGQIALDIVRTIAASGLLDQLHVELLGSPLAAINQTEDGEAFRQLVASEKIPLPESTYTSSQQEALAIANDIGYPVMMRRGQTRGIARNSSELVDMITDSIGGGRILIERAIRSFKAVELVVMRDAADTCVLLGTLENFDPVGVNPVNTVAITPAQSLTDSDRSALRAASFKVARAIDLQGVATVSFAVEPTSTNWYMLKFRLGLAWGTDLVERATGYPVATVNTAVALGRNLADININGDVPDAPRMVAAIEPGIDAIVARFPQFPQSGLSGAKLGPQLAAGGAIITAGRMLESVLLQGIYSLRQSPTTVIPASMRAWDEDALTQHIIHPSDLRLAAFWVALERDYTVEELAELAHVNRIFIAAVATLVRTASNLAQNPNDRALLHTAKSYGFLDTTIANIWSSSESEVRALRADAGINPTFKALDGMGLIQQPTATYYATYEQENESVAEGTKRVIVLAPNAAAPWLNLAHESISTKMLTAINDAGYTPILVGSSPRPLICPGAKHYISNVSPELIRDIVDIEQPVGVICQTAGREGSSVARMLSKLDIPVLGSTVGATRKVPRAQLDAILDGLSDAQWRVAQDRNVKTTTSATHLAVDAIADGENVAVMGVINSLEQNESRAGTVLAVTPPRKKAAPMTDKAIDITVTMSKMMGLVGFVHADMVVEDGTITVTFIGPSASATVPFLAKTLRCDAITLACRVLLGQKLEDSNVESGQLPQAPGVHVLLPVLRSGLMAPGKSIPETVQTGLVMGSDLSLGKALIKAFAAAHEPLLDHGTVLLEEGTEASHELAPRLASLGFQIVGHEHAQQLNDVQLIVMNEPDDQLRRRATAHTVPVLNTVAADAILQVFEARAFSLAPLVPTENE